MDVHETIERVAEELRQITERLLPLLETVFGRIEQSARYPRGRGRDSEAEFEYFSFRGLVLIDEFEERPEGDGRGAFGGERLILSAEGSYFLQERVGIWSDRPGEESLWESEIWPLSARGVVNQYGLDRVVEGLHLAMKT